MDSGISQPRRVRRTTARVRLAEKTSRLLITVGGVGTIVAVSLIFFFLGWVVLPLFAGAELEAAGTRELTIGRAERTARLLADEYRVLTASLGADGSYAVSRFDDGSSVVSGAVFPDREPSAHAFSVDGETAIFGFSSGEIAVVDFGYDISFPEPESLPEELRHLPEDELAAWSGGILEHTAEGKLRHHRFRAGDPRWVPTTRAAEVLRVDHVETVGREVVCALDGEGVLIYLTLTERENMFTGEVTYASDEARLPYEPPEGKGDPEQVLLAGRGDVVLLVWADGTLHRIDARRPDEAQVAEIGDLVADEARTVTATAFLLGKSTLLVGDSEGRLGAWFLTKPESAGTVDGSLFAEAHVVPGDGSAVTAIGPSPRSRLVSVGYADGGVQLLHLTSSKDVARVTSPGGVPISVLALSPKEDALLAVADDALVRWRLDPRHPEASFEALFQEVWYEGYDEAEHVWQSSSGTDDFEEKLGLVPLVYGTVKATFYSMLFGAPLALLAAIFTSEFLDRRVRSPIKSSIEMMASLPSVVLGFLAALIIAPFVQRVLPATLALLLLWPATLLAGAYLWQLLPRPVALRLSGVPRIVCMGLSLPVAIALASVAGPWMATVFFGGNVELWLDGQVESSWGGWFLLLLPAAALLGAFVSSRWVSPRIRRHSADWTADRAGRVELAKFAAIVLFTVVLALGAGLLLDAAGYDPRGGLVGTYVQRNALVVGFVMGFAVIPIIYTLAEDALSSVPEHLRLASLGAGATPWQTAARVIVPTAMSGLFSALMIGLGRAVGETMIVLMATGNTPVMELNVFNGFRTLSANIAVELPEAVQNSTHYRTLFLAALVLFAMTFFVNTLAEVVRQRFRKRSYQL